MKLSLTFVTDNKEMKSAACMHKLIKLANMLDLHSSTQQGRQVHNLLATKAELQNYAYATENERP